MSEQADFIKTTEMSSSYDQLETKTIGELLRTINKEDQSVALSVAAALNQIEQLTNAVVDSLKRGGRLFYIGAGTSGRLGIVDASECPPTFGVPHDMVIGIIAGGDSAIRKAVEFAEDDTTQGWNDLKSFNISSKDMVIGIAASGTTPYVIGALQECKKNQIVTGCITCNQGSPLAQVAEYAVEVVVGPEVVTGSSRMKAGTAQKLVLNMITTTAMIQMGRVRGNKMVDMQLSNHKLIDRGIKMIISETGVSAEKAKEYLQNQGNVRDAILKLSKDEKN
jgi:N-acetylmuramic acid 6-phosphate etherase